MFEDGMRGLQHPLRRDGYIAFANGWVGAFPDAWMTVVSIEPKDDEYDANLMAVGTHLGDLSFANGDLLRPGKRPLRIPIRHTFRFGGDRIASSTLSFDAADLTHQLERSNA